MSEERFTKGPWVVYFPDDFHGNQNHDELVIGMDSFNSDPYDHYINHKVLIDGYDNDDSGETEANAHLIAAAPEMYSMLEMAANLFSGCDDVDELVVGEIRALLSKARGEGL